MADRLDSPFRGATPAPAAPTAAPRLAPRPMTGHEEEFVERRRNEPNTARLCNELLARCLVPVGADATQALARVRSLQVAQRDVALLELRRISLGDQVLTAVACPACGRTVEVDFRLSQLPLPDTTAPELLDVSLEEGRQARLRLPTVGDQEELLDAALETEAQKRTWLLSRLLLRYGDAQGPFSEEFTRALPTSVRSALERALEQALPDFDLSMGVTCQDCGHAFSAPFDVAAFFLPR